MPNSTKKRERKGNDKLILARILDGSLVVNIKTGTVFSRGKELVPHYDKRGRKFARVCSEGKRKAISISRIVWMAANQRLIPDGHEVHHKKERWNDRIDYLELMTDRNHFFLTYGHWPQSEEEVDEAMDEYNRC